MFPTAYSRIKSQPIIQAMNSPEREVAVGVSTSGNRNYRGKFGVAERGKRAGKSGDDEGEHDRRTASKPAALRRRRRADKGEDPRTDDRPDAEQGQLRPAEHPLQLGVGLLAARMISQVLGSEKILTASVPLVV